MSKIDICLQAETQEISITEILEEAEQIGKILNQKEPKAEENLRGE